MFDSPGFTCGRNLLLRIAVFVTVAAPASAQTPAGGVADHPLRLADCLAVSEQQQPSLAASRARLAAAQSKAAALDDLGGASAVLRPDLPLRRQQAHLGVTIAQANLRRLEVENRYAVTRAYLSVLYARAQRRALDDLIEDLTFLRDRVKNAVVKNERPEWTPTTIDLVALYLRRSEARRTEAEHGFQMSLAALREAMNLPPLFCLNIADEAIPQPQVRVCHEEILTAALAWRGEAIKAGVAKEVANLEIAAQAKLCRRGAVRTFAAGADLHASHVPQPIYGEKFRPGGIPLAMPTVLTGKRAARVESARELSDQAVAVADKTRNLIVLEAEEAYFSYQEWSAKVTAYRQAEEAGQRLARRLREEVRGSLKRVIEGILPESLLLAQTRTDYNEALFRRAEALAALERVTGGAFHAGLVAADIGKPAD